MFWLLALAQLGIVFALSARVDQMAASTAPLLFVAYSAGPCFVKGSEVRIDIPFAGEAALFNLSAVPSDNGHGSNPLSRRDAEV